MHKGKIAFVVGHRNWGKSRTLRELTHGSFQARRTIIAGVEFWIRRMSNDDKMPDYRNFAKALNPSIRPHVIAALCPQFDDLSVDTLAILKGLRARYELFFWVIEHQHATDAVVAPSEIAKLGTLGQVELFSKRVEASERAKHFERYVRTIVLV